MSHDLDLSPDTHCLRNPSFHDGAVTGLLVDGDKAVVLLRTVEREDYRLELSGVRALVGNDIREGNIISHIEVVARRRPDLSWLTPLFVEPHPSAEDLYRRQYEDRLRNIADLVVSGEACLIAITPSYGCEFLALCEGVALFRTQANFGVPTS